MTQPTSTGPSHARGIPPSWEGCWFRPGEPGGEPSAEARRIGWRVVIRSVDAVDAKAAGDKPLRKEAA